MVRMWHNLRRENKEVSIQLQDLAALSHEKELAESFTKKTSWVLNIFGRGEQKPSKATLRI
jgi:hypothetical protein